MVMNAVGDQPGVSDRAWLMGSPYIAEALMRRYLRKRRTKR